MNWSQACAYWERGAISTADLAYVARDLFSFDQGILDDTLAVIAEADPAAYARIYPVPAASQAPLGR